MPRKRFPPAGPRLVGYARVSTAEQNLDLQIAALRNAGVFEDNIWFEKVSAGSSKRPELEKALIDARAGDTFVVWKLDRLGRSLLDLLARMKELESRQVAFRSLTEGIDTSTAAGKLQLHMLGALAQFERDMIVERTKAGIAEFKKRGGRIGQPPKLSAEQVEHLFAMIKKGSTPAGAAAYFKVSRATIYNYLKGVRTPLQGKVARKGKRKK